MEKILKSMEGTPGAPGMKMYSKEDLMNMENFGDDDVDEEDDEDEAQFPSNLGKVSREKENKKDDWKRRITKGILNAGETVKNHANKVSHRIRKWWKPKKAGCIEQEEFKCQEVRALVRKTLFNNSNS
ncbi:uncharacterized protein LOC113775808 [Coffea eugenioides]|uniref:uncharacterized protein LOC113775808 n=1 Tax=Coffea eugenioides TaxID=49369 RepID=UPI000F61310E|nr:uncharacterized protein LOC113775808 [Coffea eugenioides]XP_027176626.1 uncharacterized protein LOC113775808 [Coffea eugenioides]